MFFTYKTAVTALLMFSVLFMGAEAKTGGPDAFGYTFTDSNEAGGPSFQMIDISNTGVGQVAGDDNYVGNVPINFSFPFYGNSYTDLTISTNGFISFNTLSSSSWINVSMPNPNIPNNMIAAIWDDLVVTDNVWTQTFSNCPNTQGGNGQCMITMWRTTRHFGGNTTWDFELIIYQNGNILFNQGAGNPEHGSGSTTGIENSDGTIGLEYSYNTTDLSDNLAVLFQVAPVAVPLSNSAKALLAMLFAFGAFFMMHRRKLA